MWVISHSMQGYEDFVCPGVNFRFTAFSKKSDFAMTRISIGLGRLGRADAKRGALTLRKGRCHAESIAF